MEGDVDQYVYISPVKQPSLLAPPRKTSDPSYPRAVSVDRDGIECRMFPVRYGTTTFSVVWVVWV